MLKYIIRCVSDFLVPPSRGAPLTFASANTTSDQQARRHTFHLFASAPLLLLLMQGGGGSSPDPNSLAVPAPYIAGDPTPNYFPDWTNTQGKDQVDCTLKPGEPTEVWIIFGQSNTTASANGLHYPANPLAVQNFNISDGGCYIAKPGGPIDPLLGATGYPPGLSAPYPTGSWIGVLADLRINAGKAAREIMVPIGVGGSYIRDWEPGGANNIRFGVPAHRLATAGLTPKGVLIGQGESDLYTTYAAYLASLQATINSIHSYWPNVDIYVAQETYISGYTSAAVAAAQLAVVNPAAHVHQGPNGDLLGSAYRYDNIHFSYSPGGTTWAPMWNAVLP